MPDLHARLLAEIERREGIARAAVAAIESRDRNRWWGHEASPMEYEEFIDANHPATVLAYLGALRTVVGLHAHPPGARTSPDDGRDRDGCITCTPGIAWPCPTLRAVATALDVTP